MERMMIRNKLRNVSRVENVFERFEVYAAWLSSSAPDVVEIGARLAMPIGSVILAGVIDRVDLVKAGFRGVLMGPYEADWKTELRMPLIQKALAVRYERPSEQFAVGVQALDGTGLLEVRFDEGSIRRAEKRLVNLLGASGLS